MRGQLRWRAAYVAALAVIVIMVGATLALSLQMRSLQRMAVENELVRQATVAATNSYLAQLWRDGPDALKPELVYLSSLLNGEVTALTPQGLVFARSRSALSSESLEWGSLPEVRAVISGVEGVSIREVASGSAPRLVVAIPVRDPLLDPVRDSDSLLGILHFAFPRQHLQAQLTQLSNREILIMLTATILLAALIFGLVEYLANAVRRLTKVVERITAGDLDARTLSMHQGELGELAVAFNRMADKLQSQMKKRAREKERLNTVLRVMTDGIVILNKSGEVKLINPAGARLLNTSMDKAMHRSFVQAVRDHRIAEVWKRCQASGEEEVAAIELGPTQFIRVVVTPFLRRVGRGYLVMLQDLTQMRRLQTVRQDFISNVSHELRTPLASLRALAETLRDSALDDPPAAAHFLDRMEIEVDALTQMVEELLELSRIESGQVPLRLNPVLPHAAIVPPVDRLRAQAERNQLNLQVTVTRELPLVLVDAGRIHQVVTNLVQNAIKFTPAEGTITVDASADALNVMVSVADTGSGIATNDLPRIFERFFKTDRSRAVGGTGLGLAIAKHIVQAHGGTIWAISREGKGSIFYFTMPRAEPEVGMEVPLDEKAPTLLDGSSIRSLPSIRRSTYPLGS